MVVSSFSDRFVHVFSRWFVRSVGFSTRRALAAFCCVVGLLFSALTDLLALRSVSLVVCKEPACQFQRSPGILVQHSRELSGVSVFKKDSNEKLVDDAGGELLELWWQLQRQPRAFFFTARGNSNGMSRMSTCVHQSRHRGLASSSRAFPSETDTRTFRCWSVGAVLRQSWLQVRS